MRIPRNAENLFFSEFFLTNYNYLALKPDYRPLLYRVFKWLYPPRFLPHSVSRSGYFVIWVTCLPYLCSITPMSWGFCVVYIKFDWLHMHSPTSEL